MKNRKKIPVHTRCKNCGKCCGPILVTKNELKEIKNYVMRMNSEYRRELKEQIKTKDPLACQFRDEKNKRCAIYPVRPVICRLMGVTYGMKCPEGNTCEIDGRECLDFNEEPIELPYML